MSQSAALETPPYLAPQPFRGAPYWLVQALNRPTPPPGMARSKWFCPRSLGDVSWSHRAESGRGADSLPSGVHRLDDELLPLDGATREGELVALAAPLLLRRAGELHGRVAVRDGVVDGPGALVTCRARGQLLPKPGLITFRTAHESSTAVIAALEDISIERKFDGDEERDGWPRGASAVLPVLRPL